MPLNRLSEGSPAKGLAKPARTLREVPVMSERRIKLFAGFETSSEYSAQSVYTAFAENRKKRLG